MDPKAFAQLRERQEGHYYGLGISINVRDGDITVMSLFEGSPAYKKGIRRGDVIAKINGEDAKGWTSEQAVLKLRGPRGTPVQVSIRRTGYDKLIDVEVVRDEIRIPSVHAAFMIADGTGYIQLRDFSETTDRELGAALRDLTKQGMKRLVLDIRENPGGPLDQAIKVSNRFLKKGEMIVYTRGRVQNSDKEYRAVESSDYTDLPLIALANRRSASASEIVTGALQDHDRGLVVGETTWGKALVQSIYPLSEGAGLALTTAHYFTPAGTTDSAAVGRELRRVPVVYDARSGRQRTAPGLGPEVHAASGPQGLQWRRHRAGPSDGRAGRRIQSRQVCAPAVSHDVRELRAPVRQRGRQPFRRCDRRQKARRTLTRDFIVDDAMLQDFKAFVKSQLRDPSQFDEAGFNADVEFIRAMIRFEIDTQLFDVATARRHLVEKDPQTQYALTLFAEAEKLMRATPPRHTGRESRAQGSVRLQPDRDLGQHPYYS